MRNRLEASVVRHGPAGDNLSALIERGEKPPYADFKAYLEGTIDPSIETERTKEIIRERIAKGELVPGSYNVIISSPTKRSTETSKLLQEELHIPGEVRISELLTEVRIPMISEDAYISAQSINQVRELYFEHFLTASVPEGYETPLAVYRRAEKFLHYFGKIKNLTQAEPIFNTSWIFMKFLQLAIAHQGEALNDEQVNEMLRAEFKETKRFGVVQGPLIASTEEGTIITS